MAAKVVLRTGVPKAQPPAAGGRSPRRRVQLPGQARSTTGKFFFTLRNLSCTGAMAEGEQIPPAGRDLVVVVGEMELLCRVVWAQRGRCGLEFDEPLPAPAVVALSQTVPMAISEYQAEMIAAEAWVRPTGRQAFLD